MRRMRMQSGLFVLLVLAMVLMEAVARPKVGLVLGGGGAAGVAHVGVLKVLEEQNIPVDVIAGTSMGAIVAGLYASGMSADQLETTVNSLDWLALFDDRSARTNQEFHQKRLASGFFQNFELGIENRQLKAPSGLVTGQKLMFELRRLFMPVSHIHDFDQLKIPFRAVATDIESGEAVVLKSGNIAQAVRASMAIPGFFSPVQWEGRLLVDGFVANNVPVDVAQQMGADILIVVNIPTFLERKDDLGSAVAVSFQAMQLMMLKSTRPQLAKMGPDDILIEPGVKDIGSLDFDRVQETIPLGVKAARAKLTQLRRLAIPRGQQVAPSMPVNSAASQTIARIDVNNESGLDDDVILRRLGVKVGDSYDVKRVQTGLESVHNSGYFDLVDHTTRQENGQLVLTVNAVKRSTGDQRLRFGISLNDDFRGNATYQLGVSHTLTGVNSRGAEWSNRLIFGDDIVAESAFYQPVPEANAFFDASVNYQERDFLFFEGEDVISELRGKQLSTTLDVGREFGTWGEARVGYFNKYAEPDRKVGSGEVDQALTDALQSAGIAVALDYDTTDDAMLPSQGERVTLSYRRGETGLGSDADYHQFYLRAGKAVKLDDGRLLGNVELGTTLDDVDAGLDQFSLGGLGRVSGLAENQLFGRHLANASVYYLHELASIQGVSEVFVGGSVEAGNVWTQASAVRADDLLFTGSAFAGADTPFGLLIAGVAKTEGFEIRPFLYLGRGF